MPGKRGNTEKKLSKGNTHLRISVSKFRHSIVYICPRCNLSIRSFASKGRHLSKEVVLQKHQSRSLFCGKEISHRSTDIDIEEPYFNLDVGEEEDFDESFKPQLLNLEELNLGAKRKRLFEITSEEAEELAAENALESLTIDEIDYDDISIFKEQQKYQELYNPKSNKFPLGRLRSHVHGKKARWEDEIDLLYVGIKCGLSDNEGQILLDSVHRIIERNGLEMSLKKDWKKMHEKFISIVKKNYTTKTLRFWFPKDIFGEKLFGNPLKPSIGTIFDIKEVLAEALLECDPKHFLTEYKQDVIPECMLDFGDSPVWSRISKDASEFGLKGGKPIIPLLLVISSDESHSSNTTSQQPLDFAIANCTGLYFKKYLLGYAPHTLPYTMPVLSKLLDSRGIKSKSEQERILKWVKRRNVLSFIYEAFKPIIQLGRNCFKVQIGQDDHYIQRYAMINVVDISGDGQFLDWLCGTSLRRKYMQCRQCVSSSMCRFVQSSTHNRFRDDNMMFLLGKRLESVYRRKWVYLVNGGTRHSFTEDEKQWLILGQKYGVVEGYNPLYKMFSYWRGRGITSLHRSVSPDYLHVIQKGLIEKTISWTLMILLSVRQISQKAKDVYNFTHNMSLLDDRIKTFTNHQSFQFVR